MLVADHYNIAKELLMKERPRLFKQILGDVKERAMRASHPSSFALAVIGARNSNAEKS